MDWKTVPNSAREVSETDYKQRDAATNDKETLELLKAIMEELKDIRGILQDVAETVKHFTFVQQDE